eukprot:5665778-Prymnesium_polylepis.1
MLPRVYLFTTYRAMPPAPALPPGLSAPVCKHAGFVDTGFAAGRLTMPAGGLIAPTLWRIP